MLDIDIITLSIDNSGKLVAQGSGVEFDLAADQRYYYVSRCGRCITSGNGCKTERFFFEEYDEEDE